MRSKSIIASTDWLSILLWLALAMVGWFNIYAADFNEAHISMFDTNMTYGKQIQWIGISIIVAFAIMIIDSKFFTNFSFVFYLVLLAVLIGVLLFGTTIANSKSWIVIGGFRMQPAELAKCATALALAKFGTGLGFNLKKQKTLIMSYAIFLIPAVLVLLQNDTGSALVFFAFIFVLFRLGLSPLILIIGALFATLFILALAIDILVLQVVLLCVTLLVVILLWKSRQTVIALAGFALIASGFIWSVDYAFNEVLQAHQRDRINVIIGEEVDLKGAAYNVNQSKIAIGSGGLTGKGFLNGTQTKFDFVPEQSTDFIFCTIGEEHGFLGSILVLAIYFTLLIRLIYLGERQRSDFTRIYALGVSCVFFFHVLVNIGMTIGLVPVIGIPLPFISYGGSSFMAFTIMLFILLRLDADRMSVLK